MNVRDIASICHEVNAAYCRTIGDYSQVSWEKAQEWQRESAISGVIFKQSNPNITPEQQHEEWSRHKIESGWIYGTEKSAQLKTHPCLVPYNELPQSQRVKDILFCAIVTSLS